MQLDRFNLAVVRFYLGDRQMPLSRFDRKFRSILLVIASLFVLRRSPRKLPRTMSRPSSRSIAIRFRSGMPTRSLEYLSTGPLLCPGWAPTVHSEHDFESLDYITHNPYAEWYLNSMRLDGSPTQAYHMEHFGADYDYYNFAPFSIVRFRSGTRKTGPKSFTTPAPSTWC